MLLKFKQSNLYRNLIFFSCSTDYYLCPWWKETNLYLLKLSSDPYYDMDILFSQVKFWGKSFSPSLRLSFSNRRLFWGERWTVRWLAHNFRSQLGLDVVEIMTNYMQRCPNVAATWCWKLFVYETFCRSQWWCQHDAPESSIWLHFGLFWTLRCLNSWKWSKITNILVCGLWIQNVEARLRGSCCGSSCTGACVTDSGNPKVSTLLYK